jgi:hypothetical protein
MPALPLVDQFRDTLMDVQVKEAIGFADISWLGNVSGQIVGLGTSTLFTVTFSQ